jgi:ferredoxin
VGTFQISESALPHVINLWSANATVIGPRASEDGDVVFSVLGPSDRPALAAPNPLLPPSRLLGPAARASVPEGPLVLLGVRPCDASAIGRLLAARQATGADALPRVTVVTLACSRPRTTCFCSLVGGGPSDDRGADVVTSDLGGDLLATARTAAGAALLKSGSDVIAKLSPAEATRAHELVTAVGDHRRQLEQRAPEGALEGAAQASEVSAVWTEIEKICLRCEVCARLCPAVAGHPVAERGARPTSWLSRLRRMVEPTGDRPECVGCGRCVRHCPAGIDLRVVLREQELASDFCDPP